MISRGTHIKTSYAEPKSELSMNKNNFNRSSRDITVLDKTSSRKMSRKQSSLDKPPTPLDFDRFIPWVMYLLEGIIHVNVKRTTTRRTKKKRPAGQSPTDLEIFPVRIVEKENLEEESTPTFSYPYIDSIHRRFAVDANSEVIISALYDSKENLTEIAFIDCPVLVPRQVFKAINLCLPFHKKLTRLTFKGKHLDCGVLYEISEMLPVSNLTEVILDHSYVAQGYYYILLEQASRLKYLSLSSCGIDDAECQKIATRIRCSKPAAENLLVLNLSNNNITDVGAKDLGCSLRTNRRLLYLNLCNNSITDDGAAHILLPLAEFQLNRREKVLLKENKSTILKQRAAAVGRYLRDITNQLNVASTTTTSSKYNYCTKKKSCKPVDLRDKTNRSLVDNMATDGTGACLDIFCSNTVYREGEWYSLGNLTLCSLNLAYNQLDFASILKISNVVKYQCLQEKGKEAGLLRVVITGNKLPSKCEEYSYIDECLDKAKRDAAPKPTLQCNLKKPAPVGKRKRKSVKK